MARLKEVYRKEIVPALVKQFGYKSTMEVPRIEKIVLNMGVGEAIGDKKLLENAAGDMQKISGQKPVITKAKKAIAGFKIREGYPIGCMVTLRQRRMYEFLDRLISLALPRVRDFRGLAPDGFDGHGNYTLGLAEQMVFPEIDPDVVTWAPCARIAPLTRFPLPFTLIRPRTITRPLHWNPPLISR